MSRKLGKWYWLALLAVISVMAGYAYSRDLYVHYLDYQNSEKQVRAVEKQVDELDRKKVHQEERVNQLQTDDLELEAAIRRTKKLVRPGETVYRIEERPNSAPERGEQP